MLVWNCRIRYGRDQVILKAVACFQASTAMEMRSLLFCDVTQRRSIVTDVSEQSVWSHLEG